MSSPVPPEVESGVVCKRRYPEPRGMRCAKPPQSAKIVVLLRQNALQTAFWAHDAALWLSSGIWHWFGRASSPGNGAGNAGLASHKRGLLCNNLSYFNLNVYPARTATQCLDRHNIEPFGAAVKNTLGKSATRSVRRVV